MSKKNRNKWKFNPARRKRPIDPTLLAILDEAVAEKREAAEMASGTEETVSEEMPATIAGAEAAAGNGTEEIREMAEASEAEEVLKNSTLPEAKKSPEMNVPANKYKVPGGKRNKHKGGKEHIDLKMN